MSYNTRRTPSGFGTPQQQQGQRRPVVTNNFVPGGQLSGSQQQKSQGQQQQQQQQQRPPQQQQQTGISFRNQTPQGQQQQGYQSSYPTTPQQQARSYTQGQQQTPVSKQEVKPAVQPQQQQQQPKPAAPQPAAPVIPGANPADPEEGMETGEVKKRFWTKGKGKISKAEKIRRRNLKLSKILQPKNAVMILNELVKGCTYTVDELPVKIDQNQFRGTVTFDGQEFAGTGRTKNGAKYAAAETALKHLVKNKQLVKKEDADGDEKMDEGEEESTQVMPWSHIASFAMFKLFSTWGEDPSMVNRVSAQDITGNGGNAKPAGPREVKPAKKLPENPETMNPLMLMHQMIPGAVWEELGKTATSPSVFTFNVTVEGKQFTGTGSSKKAAKKMAAFAACHDVLNITYPPDVWSPPIY